MDLEKFYWEIFAAIAGALWVLVIFIRDGNAQSLALSSAILSRLMEFDKFTLEHPTVQQYISQHADRAPAFFDDAKHLEDTLFIQAKTLVYTQLSLFDELLAITASASGIRTWIRPKIIDQKDWEAYIKIKLRHPFYRAILIREGDTYGASLRAFWKENRQDIEMVPADPRIW